jgi:exodeoxyribonuclease VII large subunit
VARAVFASPVPVVSGVGHETDTTIIDYVADLRAPTPSAAAELCTPDAAELAAELAYAIERMDICMQNQIGQLGSDLAMLVRRFEQHSPERRIEHDRQKLDELVQRCERRIEHVLALEQTRLQGLQRQLIALNPQAILARGYAVVRGAQQQIVTRPDHVVPGELLTITLRGGELQAKVE